MAEDFGSGKSTNIFEKLDSLSELRNEAMEINLELYKWEMCENAKQSNEKTEALVTALEDIESTLKYILDRKSQLIKELQSPIIPNALPVKYLEQASLVNCCKKLPEVVAFLESLKKKPHAYNSLQNVSLINHMEKNQKLGKQYISHVNRFKSETAEFARDFNCLVDALTDVTQEMEAFKL